MGSDDEEGVWIRPPLIAAWYELSVRDIDDIVPCPDDEPWGREGIMANLLAPCGMAWGKV